MIRRNGPNDYQRTGNKRRQTERKWEDFDLRFAFPTGPCSVYVIDENEWFDPKTSTKYFDGVSAKALRGPSLIVVDHTEMGHKVAEHNVNDPRVWRWIQARIKDGTFGPGNCEETTANEFVDVQPEQTLKSIRAAK
jgi:hypothetical protein